MKNNKVSNIELINCTPHPISTNDGRVYPPSGVIPRVQQNTSDFDENGIAVQSFGEVQGLPEPKDGTIFIVSAMVLAASGRKDLVAPATGHKECRRDEQGRILSVPGFVKNA